MLGQRLLGGMHQRVRMVLGIDRLTALFVLGRIGLGVLDHFLDVSFRQTTRCLNADALVHSTEKALAEHGDKVGEPERKAIEDAMADLKEALKGDDSEGIKAKANTLAQASMKLGEAMYTQQAEADAKKDAAKDDVVDAEFTEVDDDKKNKKSA